MTKQTINVGTTANDGTGDTLRTAAQKINSNFTEVFDTSQASFNKANTALTHAQAAFNYANTIVSDTQVDPVARSTSNASFLKANSATTLAQEAYNFANTIVSDTQIDPVARSTSNASFTQSNTATTLAQAAFNYANTIVSDTQIDPVARTTANNASNNITLIQGVDVTQNTNITNATNTATGAYTQANTANVLAQAAFDKANTGADLGDLVITGGTITTEGVSDIYLAPNGEGYAWINVPSDANAANGAATVIGHGVPDGSGVRISSYNNTWYFKPDGTMTFPSNVIDANNNSIDIKSSSFVEMKHQGLDAVWRDDPTLNQTTYVWTDSDGTYIEHIRGANDGDATWDHVWGYKNDGSMKFPTLTVPINDNANPSGTGQTLKFTDATQQAIIYGPPSTDTLNNAERIIIQGAPGYTGTAGEGGDVYVWAGPGGSTDGNGGDIKVRAGQGIGTGTGGYLNLQAGDSSTGAGGYINIESGESGTPGQGGDIDIIARTGGAIDINAQSGGEVGIHTQSSSWYFSPSGVMSFPNDKLKVGGGFSIQTANTIPNSVSTWEGAGGWNEMQYTNLATTGGTGTGLTVDVAAGGGGYISINEITINNPGSGYTNGDVITIENENNLTGTFVIGVPQRVWSFGTDGSLTFPDATVQTTAFTGKLTGPDTANVAVNLNGTVSVTTDDEGNIARWTYDTSGNIILPTEAGFVTTGTVSVGYYDITAQSAVGALASFYSTTANNAVVEITARNDLSHTNKVQIISDGATGEEYVNIELYDGGQTYGTTSWKFHNSGKLESAIGFAPTTSVGVAGDKRGMIVHTTTYMYFCTADYDGTTDIWRRMQWNASDTW